MRSRRPRVLIAGAVLGACTPRPSEDAALPDQAPDAGPESKAEPVTNVPEVEAPVDHEAAVRRTLEPYVVRRGAPHHRVLYTWTADWQGTQLRYDPVLLRFAEAANGPSRFDKRVRTLGRSHWIRKLLSDKKRGTDRRRFAWPHPWPTSSGWVGEDYGSTLVRVELEADTLVAHLDDTGRWSFEELDGTPVDEAIARADASRIGLVFHEYVPPPAEQEGGRQLPFREYVLVNEAKIGRWALADDELVAKLRADLRALRRVRDALHDGFTLDVSGADVSTWATNVAGRWCGPESADAPPTAASAWSGSLALGNEAYRPSESSLDALVERLETIAEQHAQAQRFEHTPDDAELAKRWTRPAAPKRAPRPLHWT